MKIFNSKDDTQQLVEQVHHEFENAAEEFLQEATSILKDTPTINEDKISRLSSLGFKQVKEVVEGNKIIEKKKITQEQIELVQYYRVNYPLNKFITKEQVKVICEKYGLVCAEVSRYKGFVPEKNLKQIEKFNLKKEDVYKSLIYETYAGGGIYKSYTWEQLAEKYDCSVEEIIQKVTSRKITPKSGKYITTTLQICAPISDIDMTGMEVKDYKVVQKQVPDPVVLQPVKGGYLILTAWSDEASDPIVINEISQ